MLLYLLLSKMENIYKEKSYQVAQFNSVITRYLLFFNGDDGMETNHGKDIIDII